MYGIIKNVFDSPSFAASPPSSHLHDIRTETNGHHHTEEELALAGACDIGRITSYVNTCRQASDFASMFGLSKISKGLNAISQSVVDHRLRMNPMGNRSQFLREHCGNDLYIHQFRHETKQLVDWALEKNRAEFAKLPSRVQIPLRQMLLACKSQAVKSFPYTGYLNTEPRTKLWYPPLPTTTTKAAGVSQETKRMQEIDLKKSYGLDPDLPSVHRYKTLINDDDILGDSNKFLTASRDDQFFSPTIKHVSQSSFEIEQCLSFSLMVRCCCRHEEHLERIKNKTVFSRLIIDFL
jgi:hypothetical protein